jgi:phosphoribulokinase
MIDTLGWPTLAERRLKTRLIMFYKITHCLIAIPTDIVVPSDNRLRKHHSQSYQHIQTSKDTYKWSFFPHTIIQWNMLPQHTVQDLLGFPIIHGTSSSSLVNSKTS